MTRNGKRRGVDRHWLGVILFVLPGETAAATRRQRGSVAGLTFTFSCSQLAPFIPIESCSLRGRLGRRGHGRGAEGAGGSWGFGSAAGWMVPGAFKRGARTNTRGRGIRVMSAQTSAEIPSSSLSVSLPGGWGGGGGG